MIGRIISNGYARPIYGCRIGCARDNAYGTTKRIDVDDPRMSRIVVNNEVVYESGQTESTGSNIEEETKNVLAEVDSLLMEAGADKSKLLTSSIWLKDITRETRALD